MKTQPLSTDASRRSVLKKLGTATAAAAAYPVLSGFTKTTPGAAPTLFTAKSLSPIRVAFMYPHASSHDACAVRAGVEAYLRMHRNRLSGRRISMQPVEIGVGVNQAIGAARKIAATRSADIVVGVMSPPAVQWIRDMFEDGMTPLVAVHAGERLSNRAGTAPHLVHSTLGMWQAAYAAGTWAAATLGRRCAIAATFAESGFDMLPAFRHAFEQAGGSVAATCVVNAPTTAVRAHDVAGPVASADADFVLVLGYEQDRAEIVRALGAHSATSRLPVLLLDPRHALSANPAAAVQTVLSVGMWSPAHTTRESAAFGEAFAHVRRDAPTTFALLGFDTARLIDEALLYSNADPSGLVSSLAKVSFQSARGTIAFDAASRAAYGNAFVASNQPGVAPIALAGAPAEALLSASIPQQHGWISSYVTV